MLVPIKGNHYQDFYVCCIFKVVNVIIGISSDHLLQHDQFILCYQLLVVLDCLVTLILHDYRGGIDITKVYF